MSLNERQSPAVNTCGCAAKTRRVCDWCWSAEGAFLACSRACLDKHQRAAHGENLPRDAHSRAKAALTAMNLRDPGNWDRYAPHRRRLMNAVCTAKDRGTIGVFGAGNCADVDIETLSRAFDQIHLIDLDSAALARVHDALPSTLRERTHLHGDIDLSGFLTRLDDWGESFPATSELAQQAVAAARQNLSSIGCNFDVVLSTCVLSQLVGAYHRAWATSQENWQNLEAATTAVYLATIAGATRPGGEGFLAFDVLSSTRAPALEQLVDASSDVIEAVAARELRSGAWQLEPNPEQLLLQLKSPGLSALVASPRLTAPWLWDIGGALQLVYGLAFRRP